MEKYSEDKEHLYMVAHLIPDAPEVDNSQDSRLNFIKNVYICFSLQQFFLLLAPNVSIKYSFCWLTEQIWAFLIAIFIAISIICYIQCEKIQARKSPQKYIILFLFTLVESYAISAISCFIVQKLEVGYNFIFLTFNIYIFVVSGLTILIIIQKKYFDFSSKKAMIIPFILTLFFALFVFIIDQTTLYPMLLIIIYNLYIQFDLHLMVGHKKRYQLRQDDFLLGALVLNFDMVPFVLEQLKQTIFCKK
ncbi:unnamed protein product [Paramecium sonneborni]|uniref:Transmembrane protein n=1 Tax=Paramecium sonneborni TaxID=65129 RepID=A0A8S1MIK0_9CILI|nr:unnamed protein product [Paramecium sonneborni]